MLQHAVVAVDFSEGQERFLEALRRFSGSLGIRRATLVHVLDITYPGALDDSLEASRAELYQEQLDEAGAALRAAGLEVDSEVRKGSPAWELQRVASDQGADCVVLGGRGHTALGEFFLGSVLLDSARLTRVPLVVLPEAGGGDPEGPVILGTDGSEAATGAEQLGRRYLEQGVPVVGVYAPPTPEPKGWRKHEMDRARARLAELAGEGAETDVLPGYPWQVLTRLAHERSARAIIVGKRGYNALEALLLGSSAEAVCRRAEHPVIVVPGDKPG